MHGRCCSTFKAWTCTLFGARGGVLTSGALATAASSSLYKRWRPAALLWVLLKSAWPSSCLMLGTCTTVYIYWLSCSLLHAPMSLAVQILPHGAQRRQCHCDWRRAVAVAAGLARFGRARTRGANRCCFIHSSSQQSKLWFGELGPVPCRARSHACSATLVALRRRRH